jgi:hypothetical protein
MPMTKPVLCAAMLCSLAAGQAAAQLRDAYGPKIEWQQPLGLEVTPIHVGLLPNGRLFFVNNYNYFENPGFNLRMPGFEPEYVSMMDITPANAAPPASVTIQTLVSPAPLGPSIEAATNSIRFKSVSCGGHALTAEGKLFFASGVDATVDLDLYASGNLFGALTVNGIAESFSIDPATLAWTRHPDTLVPGPVTGRPLRWYATVTRLADSKMLVTGGFEKVLPNLLPNNGVEVFDPAANTWTAISRHDETPAGIENPDYPHVFQLPYPAGQGTLVLMIGGSGEPMFLSMNGTQKSWTRTQNLRPGAAALHGAAAPGARVFPNHGSSSALLPIRLPGSGWGYANGSVIQVGGWTHTRMQGQIDVYDPVANAWRPTKQLHAARVHPSTVILPDGRILVLGGHDGMSAVEQTGYAEYVDPRNDFAVSRGTDSMPESRAYHAVAVLLPDGRVLIGSGNADHNDAREHTNFRYYSPDYMFKPRPQLASAPDEMAIGEPFGILVAHGTRVGEAALVGLGSQTHSFDMNQRHVQLATHDPRLTLRQAGGAWTPASPEQCRTEPAAPCYDLHVLQAPPNPETAPRGHYLLFLLDADRVPSEGRIVRLR